MAISRILAAVLPGFILRFAQGLRFPHLFLLFGFLFIVDCLIPNPIPFIDEIMLGLMTLLFAKLKRRKEESSVQTGPKHG